MNRFRTAVVTLNKQLVEKQVINHISFESYYIQNCMFNIFTYHQWVPLYFPSRCLAYALEISSTTRVRTIVLITTEAFMSHVLNVTAEWVRKTFVRQHASRRSEIGTRNRWFKTHEIKKTSIITMIIRPGSGFFQSDRSQCVVYYYVLYFIQYIILCYYNDVIYMRSSWKLINGR